MLKKNATIGKYEIVRVLGKGGMSIVYLAYDPLSKKEIALKVANFSEVDPDIGKDKFQQIFFNEAHAAKLLKHPDIIKIYDADITDTHCFISMEYIPGNRTLKNFCKPDTLLPIYSVAKIIYTLAKALDYSHRLGIIHRDIKPSNILVTPDDEVRLSDFGIAVINNPENSQTQFTSGLVGSPLYMSPEQISQQKVTHHSDIFSLGIMFFELLLGHHPFVASSLASITHRITTDNPPPLRLHRKDLPKHLDYITHRMLKKNPQERYQTGLDLAADLSIVFSDLEKNTKGKDEEYQRFQKIKKLKFFEKFSERDIWELLRSAIWVEEKNGKQIVKDGEIEECFYVLISGIVAVKKYGRKIDQLQPGSCFGEMGYFTKTHRTADITAVSDVLLLKINAAILERANADCQLNFLKAFVATLISRLADTTASLARIS